MLSVLFVKYMKHVCWQNAGFQGEGGNRLEQQFGVLYIYVRNIVINGYMLLQLRLQSSGSEANLNDSAEDKRQRNGDLESEHVTVVEVKQAKLDDESQEESDPTQNNDTGDSQQNSSEAFTNEEDSRASPNNNPEGERADEVVCTCWLYIQRWEVGTHCCPLLLLRPRLTPVGGGVGGYSQ